jgi:teichuronic acid exporter
MTMSEKTFHHALKWSYVMNWGEQITSAALAFVLAVILGPSDFGLIAIAMVYILFIHMFLDQGLVAAIIQRKDLAPEHLDSVFWLVQGVCLILVAIAIALSGWWATINHLPKLASIIFWLSITIPIESLAVVQKAVLQREMDFRSLSIRTNLSVIGGGLVGLLMALMKFGVWSLVGQQISTNLMALVMLWSLSHWRPGFRFSHEKLKELFHFSMANFVAKLGVFTNQQVNVLLMGIFFGPVAVGLYRFAAKAMNTFFSLSQSSLLNVSLPEFSRWQDDPVRLRKSVLACIRLCGVLTIPALAGLAATSDLVMGVVGPKWLDASGGLKLLCIFGMLEGFGQFAGPLLQAVNRPRLLAGVAWLQAVLNATLLGAAAVLLHGASDRKVVLGVSVTNVIAVLTVGIPLALYSLRRFCNVTIFDVLRKLMPSIIAGVATAVVALIPQHLGIMQGWRPAVELSVLIALGAPVGIGIVLALDLETRVMLGNMIPAFASKESRGLN